MDVTPEITPVLADGGASLVLGLFIFFLAGLAMVLGALVVGWFIRPRLPHPDKGAPYECGEPTIGPGWVQFDLRFYVVALVFLVFDVEIALFWPWAVVFGSGQGGGLSSVKAAALYDMLFFFAVLVVGFCYLWRFGYLDWVRASTAQQSDRRADTSLPPPPPPRAASA